MAFSKKKDNGLEKKRWQSFYAQNADLIESLDLPSPVIETQAGFEDFLMHGYLDHHDDPTKFTIDGFDPVKMEKFKKLVDRYFAGGYFDPGLMAVGFEERLRLAKKYPNQFDKSFSEIEFDHDIERLTTACDAQLASLLSIAACARR